EKMLPIFHYGLKPGGFLVLGESESVGKFQYLFEPLTPRGLIYRKKQAQPQSMIFQEAFIPSTERSSAKPQRRADLLTVLGETVDKLIMTEYGPATLLVNNNLDILVFRGDVAPYLSPESGVASFNVTKILRKDLRSQVQTVLYRAKKENKVFKETVSLKQKGQPRTVAFEIRPLEIPGYNEPYYLVLFTEVQPHVHIYQENETAISPVDSEDLKDREIRELSEDLEATKQSLQALVEGQEATNEELRSSMEEIQSSNEELQSTNEELETAKEELQSSNEELQTLNEELKNRNQALSRLNDDLTNLQMNLDIAVVIVDSDLRIRRFTAAAQELLRISPSDVGGSIANVTPGVHIEDLEKTITEVITKLTPVNREVEGLEGSCYEMQVRPYLTEDKKIDGAFLSFTDITKRKKVEKELEEYTKNLETLVEKRTSQLKDSERLAAIGTTAGMVGHDIRNPMQAITNDIYLAKSELASTVESQEKKNVLECLSEVEKNIEYINKIVLDLQDLARPLNPHAEESDLKLIIDHLLTKYGLPENVKVNVKMEPAARKFVTDTSFINRIMNNLVSNAVQAMPNGGKLTIDAYKDEEDIVISIEDTGVGIPEQVKSKLFTPMFTTKAKGQGFGLVVIKRMTEALGGTVTFESELGKGTKFIVCLPPLKK
ncbi:MAG TPA: ATP-binding protein, partial [Candidatus Sulfotelmatobacter sp.]|nr:ATP-binding protein [Candidatus Sulfotelmatobacter sp.]